MIKVISCKIFECYMNRLDLDQSLYDIEYLEVQLHNKPKYLSKQIQNIIDHSYNYEKIIILYGLCGNMLLNIQAREVPLILMKAHDCCSILLGGYKRYQELFKNKMSSSWTCKGLLENNASDNSLKYNEWVIQYGQEEADYLKSILCQECEIYIAIDEDKSHICYKYILEGNLNYLKDVIELNRDCIELHNNEKIQLTNDDQVIKKNLQSL